MSMTSSLMHNMKIHNASRSQPHFRLPVFPMIVLGILLAYGISVQAQPDLDKRMKLLNMLDKLDEQDFNDALVSADRCTYSRNFACAQSQLDQAQKLILSQDHRHEFYLASQRLADEIHRVREEEAIALQLAEEQRQMERDRQRLEAEREEWEAEQRRIAREMEYEADHDPYNTGTDWQMIMSVTQAGLDAYSDITRQKHQARREQLAAQQQANQIKRVQQEREQAARQQEYNRRQQAFERKQREMQRDLDARRLENERRQRANQQRQAEYAQRQAQAVQSTMHAGYSRMGTNNKADTTVIANASHSNTSQIGTSGSSSNSAATSNSNAPGKAQAKSKVYEPMPTTAQATTDMFHGSREYALELARLKAVNQIAKKCRDKKARIDSPSWSDLREGIAPPRWNYSAPDCRQGGWEGKEWKCDAYVSGTCYRMQ